MQRSPLPIFVFLLAASAVVTSSSPSEENAPPKSVSIYVAATSPKGQLVALSPADLSIQEDKQPTHIDQVECGKPEPLLLAVLLDTSLGRGTDPFLPAHYDTLNKFLSSTLAKDDTAYIVTFGGEAKPLTAMTSDARVLAAALDKLKSTAPLGKHASYDAVKTASDQNLSVDHVRRVIVMIGNFYDHASKINISQALAAPLKSQSTVFFLVDDDARRQQRIIQDTSEDDALRIARETGGQAFVVNQQNEFPAALDSIHNVLTHSCRVKYTPSFPNETKDLLPLSVKAVRGHVTLFAPQSRPATLNAPQP